MNDGLKYPKPIILMPKQNPIATLIFLHGLGDSAHGWLDTMKSLHMVFPDVKFVLPTAANQPVTINMGMTMPSWYDIYSLGHDLREDLRGIQKTKNYILNLIEDEVKLGTPYERILLGGFSQGGACSLYVGYSVDFAMGGLICLSAYMPLASELESRINANNVKTPLFQCHGERDPVIKYDYGLKTQELLRKKNINVTFKSYAEMGHSTCTEELKDLNSWLKTILPK